MSLTPEQMSRYATQVVAKLYEDDALRQEFMGAYNNGPDAIKAFLIDKLDMPDAFASEIVKHKDQALSNYIGTLVCNYLW